MPTDSKPDHNKSSSQPSKLSLWLKKLPRSSLAIDSHIARDVHYLLKDEDCTSDKLAKTIQQDPIFCLALFQYTDNKLKKRDGEVQGLTHLIGLTGINSINDTLRKSPNSADYPEGLKEILAASMFAGQITATLMGEKHHCSLERFFLPSLFFNAPLWLAWSAAPKMFAQGQILASRKQKSYIKLSTKHLGFSITELFKKAKQYIHLPTTTLKALTIDPSSDVKFWARLHHYNKRQLEHYFRENKTLMHHFYSIEMGIYLFNQYALAVYLDWNGKHISRYEKLLCRYLKMPKAIFRKRIRELCLNTTLPNYYSDELKPENRYLGMHRDHIFDESPEQNSQALGSWLKKIRKCGTVNSALDTTLEALTKGLGAEHCIIMEVDERDIHTQKAYGFQQASPINNLHIDRKQQKALFNQLIKRPACLNLSEQSSKKAFKTMPKEFIHNCEAKPCGLLSVFHNQKPKALIYCDHASWDNEKHSDFKKVGQYLSLTLQQIH